MLRDLRFLRRNSGKTVNAEEAENLPLKSGDSLIPQISGDPSRPPLNAIQEHIQIPRVCSDQEMTSSRANKPDRTPGRSKAKNSETQVSLRTPDKQVAMSKGRHNLSQKFDYSSTNSAIEMKDEVRPMPNTSTPGGTRVLGRTNSCNSDCTSTQSTPTKSVNRPPTPGFNLASVSRPPLHMAARLGNYAASASPCHLSNAISTLEVPYFELKEYPSFWMEHNVQVLIRIRPLNNIEKKTFGFNRCLKQESSHSVTWIGPPETRFMFDHVACEAIDQETLFRMVGLPMVENCLSGYNSCMFAYGQTGSGKTYTMLGEIDEIEVNPSLNRGMTPRIFEFLFARIRAEEESRRDEKLKYHCKCSFLEIYNEQISDLLDPSSTNLMLREDTKKGVYVENLSEFEVETVGDILQLLTEGSSNRRVAATNMNKESSRSHSVFTCVIESKWEKDSTTNFRFARLNLVDLAGSERQKTSGADGERLKEAANINKSLSTLGHVIMVLVDVAHGKQRHIPYRDSRLTFLLQDSLGGNSKTVIIANVSSSICSAAETMNTLKFAQRAKLIQNNAIVNEDSSGDINSLKNQILLLKEELSALKQEQIARPLSNGMDTGGKSHGDRNEKEPQGEFRLSCKQLKSLETTLSGALRREQLAEISNKQRDAEIEQLNRLVSQREDDTRCTKMMLKFREDKIQRLESLLDGLMSADDFLLKENHALSEEIQLLRARIDKNPEVTRFALENIRLLEKVRQFQDLYEEGEKEMLMAEISELRNQLVFFLNENSKHPTSAKVSEHGEDKLGLLHMDLQKAMVELDETKMKLISCLEENASIRREMVEMRELSNGTKLDVHAHNCSSEVIKDSVVQVPLLSNNLRNTERSIEESRYAEGILNLQLELDIIKTILQEERSYRAEMEKKSKAANQDLQLANEKVHSIMKDCKEVQEELKNMKLVVEALESQNIELINEMDNLTKSSDHCQELLKEKELEISSLKEHAHDNTRTFRPSERGDSLLESKLKKMHESLEKAKSLNVNYRRDIVSQDTNEKEMEEARKQVEAETVEVIVCLQEELSNLQQEVENRKAKETESMEKLEKLQTDMENLEGQLYSRVQENEKLAIMLEDKEKQLRMLMKEYGLVASEIEGNLLSGNEALSDASEQVDGICSLIPHKETSVNQQFGRIKACIVEKELLIEELNKCLKDAVERKYGMDVMLRSLREAAMAMIETHQQECSEKDREILHLKTDLNTKESAITELLRIKKNGQDQHKIASSCATAALVLVNRLWEVNLNLQDALHNKDTQFREFEDIISHKDAMLHDQSSIVDEANKQIHSVEEKLEASEEFCIKLKVQLSEENRKVEALLVALGNSEENNILETQEKIKELSSGVSTLMSCTNQFVMGKSKDPLENNLEKSISFSAIDECQNGDDATIDTSTKDVGSYSIGNERNAAVLKLKRETEFALRTLQHMLVQMDKFSAEKAETSVTEKCSLKNLESLTKQASLLQYAIENFGAEIEISLNALDAKIKKVEEMVQGSFIYFSQQREIMEDELDNANALAEQKVVEASCILEKFEEIQETVKEADITINELMIANEALKLTTHELREKEDDLNRHRSILLDEIQGLKISNEQTDQKYVILESKYKKDFILIKDMFSELEDAVSASQTSAEKEWTSASLDHLSMMSQLPKLFESLGGMLEDVWSEIIINDCAMSVLHICQLGNLFEAAAQVNAKNGLLCRGLSESNSQLSRLHEHNLRSREELEKNNAIKGMLLADQQCFSRVSREVGEAGFVTLKLTCFEKKIQDLQLLEEKKLQRHADLDYELGEMMKELDLSTEVMIASILYQERLVKEKDTQLQYQEEIIMVEAFAKDIGLLILSTELHHMSLLKENLENDCIISLEVMENLKKDIVLKTMEVASSELVLFDRERENEDVLKNLEMKEAALQSSSMRVKELCQQIQILQNDASLLRKESNKLVYELEKKDEKVRRISFLETDNEMLQHQLDKCKEEYAALAQELEDRKTYFDVEDKSQRDKISALENCIARLEFDLCVANARVEEKNKLINEANRMENLSGLNMKFEICIRLARNATGVLNLVAGNFDKLDDMFQRIAGEIESAGTFVEQFEYMENLAMQLDSEILSLDIDLLRKDDVLKGLLFDLSLLQESASNSKDQKDEMEQLQASLSALQKVFESKTLELEQAVAGSQILEAQLQEKASQISALELDRANTHDMISSLSNKNDDLLVSVKDALDGKTSIQIELSGARLKIEKLDMQISEMEMAMVQMSSTTESLKKELDIITCQKDELDEIFFTLTEELKLARALAEDNEAVALEAQEMADIQKGHAEEKEEEVKLLEKSIDELECTINVLEHKVDIVKGEAERQRLQREELELELLGVKEQMRNVESKDLDIKRCVDEKEKSLQESLLRVQLLENEISARDNEISQCKAHISELNLHAEAQANEYKQKFKALEIMVEQLKCEVPITIQHSSASSSNKLEKSSTSKPKGSGSPFKCMGLGLVQQLKSERDEELSAGKKRIEELETLAASRQKEIFMLKARLATTESMTHDVIRDLLGVKLNMKSYADLIENQQLDSLMEAAGHHKVEAETKEQEVVSLKQQINEFIEERNGWLEEIERKQAEIMAAHIAVDKLRRQEQLLSTENDILKMENSIHKKRAMELESEVKKLSGQQNIQQRIHHHAKIKKENNLLRSENEELCFKLRRTETILSRVEKELAQFGATNGKAPYINFDEEQLLNKKLQETEEERMQLAQKLLGLCTSVLKAAGLKRPTSEISVSVAEEALDHLKSRVVSLEMELEDAKLKSRISNERARLSELKPQASAAVSPGRNRMLQTNFLSTFDR